MKASEAHLIAESKQLSDYLEQFGNIITQIKHMASGGYFYLEMYIKMIPKVENDLKELGYTITKSSDRNDVVIKISWQK